MASFPLLEDRDITQVTEIISAKNSFRFSNEYLGIEKNEYDTIEYEAGFIHHDTLFECITRWKNKTEAEGLNSKDELIRILREIRKEHGWFSIENMTFLTDVTGIKITADSKFIQHIHHSRLRGISIFVKILHKKFLLKLMSSKPIHYSCI